MATTEIITKVEQKYASTRRTAIREARRKIKTSREQVHILTPRPRLKERNHKGYIQMLIAYHGNGSNKESNALNTMYRATIIDNQGKAIKTRKKLKFKRFFQPSYIKRVYEETTFEKTFKRQQLHGKVYREGKHLIRIN